MKSLLIWTFTVGLAAAVGSSRAEEAEAPRPMTVEDLWAMERVGSPRVSPDGRWVAFTVTSYSFDDNEGNPDLWLVPADGSEPPRRLTWNDGPDGSPRWSPDGRYLGFISKRGEDTPAQLYRLPMAGGEAEPLTELPVSVGDFRWFPDGRRIAFSADTFPDLNDDFEKVKERLDERKEEDKTEAKISDRRLLRFWDRYQTDGMVPHVFVLDLENREIRDLMPGMDQLMGFNSFSWDLAPDGGEVAFSANDTEPPWQKLNFDLYLLPVADRPVEGGEIRRLTVDNPAWDSYPVYSPDGRYLLFGRTRRPEISPDFTRLARYDRESGEIVELTGEWDHEPAGWTVTPDGGTVLFHAQSKGYRHLYAMPIDGGEPRVVIRGGTTEGVDADAEGRLFYLLESLQHPSRLMTVPPDGGEPAALTHFNQERLAQLDLGSHEDVTFEGAGGDPVQMHVLYPPGFDDSEKWPLVVLVHGGPHGAWLDNFHFRWNAPLFAAPGYVVAAVNFHGSTGFGQELAESILGNHAEKPFEDVMKATDHMLERGFIDPERMAAAGGSYGGYMVSWILGHTDRYRCLVNHAGVYDLMAQFASDYTWSRGNNYGAEPWEDPERIDRYSPSRFAKNFSTPTLILHGELDYRVPVTQGINLHHVLTGKGVPSRIVIFPKENHWILKPQAAKLWWSEVHGWLAKYLGEDGAEEEVGKEKAAEEKGQ